MMQISEIDTAVLIGKVPSLKAVKRGARSWNEAGEMSSAPSQHLKHSFRGLSSIWNQSKLEIFLLLGTTDPAYGLMRQRLDKYPPRSTSQMVSTLAFWLSGKLGVPISITTPVVVVILYRIAESSVADLVSEEGAIDGS